MSDEDTTTAEVADEATEESTATTPNESDAPEADDKEEEWDPERAKRKIAKLNSEAAGLRKRLTEAPKAEDAAAKDKRITDLSTENLRLDVALDLGLPKEIASRLQGADRDEMVADAQKLIELLAPSKRPAARKPTEALRGGASPDDEPEERDLDKLGSRMFRR